MVAAASLTGGRVNGTSAGEQNTGLLTKLQSNLLSFSTKLGAPAIGERRGLKVVPVNLVDWDSDFFLALSLGLVFDLSTALS